MRLPARRSRAFAYTAALASVLVASVAAGRSVSPTAAVPGLASPNGMPAHAGLIAIATPRIDLDPIRIEDIAPAGLMALGRLDGTARSSAGGLSAGGTLPVPPVRPMIERRMRSVWRTVLPAGRSVGDVNVKVEAESLIGGQAQLESLDSPGLAVPVTLRNLPSRVSEDAAVGRIVEGDVSVQLRTQDLRVAGRYRLRLVITLEGT